MARKLICEWVFTVGSQATSTGEEDTSSCCFPNRQQGVEGAVQRNLVYGYGRYELVKGSVVGRRANPNMLRCNEQRSVVSNDLVDGWRDGRGIRKVYHSIANDFQASLSIFLSNLTAFLQG